MLAAEVTDTIMSLNEKALIVDAVKGGFNKLPARDLQFIANDPLSVLISNMLL
jgi:hypothetical protein